MEETPTDGQFLEFINKFNTACRDRDTSFLGRLFPPDIPPEEFASVVDFFSQAVGAIDGASIAPTVMREGNRFEAVYEGDLGDGLTQWGNDFYHVGGEWLKFDPREEQDEGLVEPIAEDLPEPLILTPESSDRGIITPLGYLDGHDEVLGKTYAFAAYKEENPNTGKWAFKIKALVGAGTSIDPDHPSLRTNMAKAAMKGEDHILIGFSLIPKKKDSRRIENRLYFDDDLKPTRLKMHIVTRKSDGSPTAEKTLEIAWPAPVDSDEETKQLIPLPRSMTSTRIDQLGYLDSYDVIADKDYAYLAYQETKTNTGQWTIKIKAKSTAGASIDPNHPSFKKNLDDAAKKGESCLAYGFRLTPKDSDPRRVETLIHFDEARNPSKVEIHLVTRNADGSPKDERVLSFPWPSTV